MHGSSDLRPASLYETQGLIRLQHPVSHAVFYSMRNLLLLFFPLIVIGATSSAAGQSAVSRENLYGVTYRPMEARYLVGRYPHFDLIYQAGTEATAFEIATRLERQLAATQRFVGAPTDRLQMPVIVNGYNDRSNGFVSPFPFRQEIEAPSIKSNALTVPFPSWPAAVAPHELVHAAHADVDAGIGVGGAIRWLGPDWSRVINLVAPSGLIEGAAVYRESQLYLRAGRLNAPLATMTFRAAMLSEDPWSMTQMLEAPTYTRPFDRHYVGGGQAFAFLTERGASSEPAFFHRAIRLHHRAPFLGFGIGLWHGTGAPPARLGRTLQDSLVARVRAIHTARQPFTDVDLIDGADGLHYRRPHWLTDSTLVVHAQGYATRTGFYAIDEPTGRRQFISAQRVTEAYGISIAPDSTDLYFSRYVADPLVTRQAFAEVHRLDLSDGTTTQLTRVGRAHAPVTTPDGQLWTLQNEGSINQWSLVGPDGTVEPLTEMADARFRQIAPSPRGGQVAVLLNVQGEQRIYRAVLPGDAQRPRLNPWLGHLRCKLEPRRSPSVVFRRLARWGQHIRPRGGDGHRAAANQCRVWRAGAYRVAQGHPTGIRHLSPRAVRSGSNSFPAVCTPGDPRSRTRPARGGRMDHARCAGGIAGNTTTEHHHHVPRPPRAATAPGVSRTRRVDKWHR